MNIGRKIALSVGVVSISAAAIGVGTFATFTAQTTNPANTFATGTLVLSNTKQAGSACLSTGGGTTDVNANGSCDSLFGLGVQKPGDSGGANLTVANVGSLNASAFKVFGSACTPSNAAAETYHGTGNLCTKAQLTIQQYSDAAFTTPSACVYGGAAGSTCNFSDPTKTLGAFASTYNSSGSGLAIGSGLASGASGYFRVAVQLPSDADNTYQGRQASVAFNWFAQQ